MIQEPTGKHTSTIVPHTHLPNLAQTLSWAEKKKKSHNIRFLNLMSTLIKLVNEDYSVWVINAKTWHGLVSQASYLHDYIIKQLLQITLMSFHYFKQIWFCGFWHYDALCIKIKKIHNEKKCITELNSYYFSVESVAWSVKVKYLG